MKTQTYKNILILPVTAMAALLWIVMLNDPLGDNARVFEYLLDPSPGRIGWAIGYCAPIFLFTYWAKWCWTDNQIWGGKDGR